MHDTGGLQPKKQNARTIVITGASSGIGKALALRYALEGGTLALMGRDQARLETVANECRKLGASVRMGLLDVRNRTAMMRWLDDLDRSNPVDLAVANAGLMAGTPPNGEIEPPGAAYSVIETNVLGVLNTIQPLLPSMMSRRSGQIVIISSVAGFIPLPDCPSYSASKSAVLSYGLSLRTLLSPYGIGVSVVCPGYITTPMTLRESGHKPFEMPPEKAVDAIVAGLRRNRSVIAFPFMFALATRLHGLLPDYLRSRLLAGARFTVSED
jgi:short-subunit dehydrogenase